MLFRIVVRSRSYIVATLALLRRSNYCFLIVKFPKIKSKRYKRVSYNISITIFPSFWIVGITATFNKPLGLKIALVKFCVLLTPSVLKLYFLLLASFLTGLTARLIYQVQSVFPSLHRMFNSCSSYCTTITSVWTYYSAVNNLGKMLVSFHSSSYRPVCIAGVIQSVHLIFSVFPLFLLNFLAVLNNR